MNKKEITDYITRMVPDIARKCACKDDDVWRLMHYLSKCNLSTLLPSHGKPQQL